MTPDSSWRNEAACQGMDPATFFPIGDHDACWHPGYRGSTTDPYATARLICRGCVVADECHAYAMTIHGMHGYYASTPLRTSPTTPQNPAGPRQPRRRLTHLSI